MSKACWDRHILRRHAELEPHLDRIIAVIERPDYVYFDAHFANRESFYVFGNVPEYARHFLKVSIEFSAAGEGSASTGDVVTAYICSNRKPKETLKWLRAT